MRKVEVIIDIQAKPETVLSAFTDPDMLRHWWGVERELIDKRPGGLYTLAWGISETGFGFISTGTIKKYRSDKKLVVENLVYLNPQKPFFGPMTLTVEVKEKGHATELYVCQDGYQYGSDWDWYFKAVEQAWPTVVQKLKDYLEKL